MSHCGNCGNTVFEGDAFCTECGCPVGGAKEIGDASRDNAGQFDRGPSDVFGAGARTYAGGAAAMSSNAGVDVDQATKPRTNASMVGLIVASIVVAVAIVVVASLLVFGGFRDGDAQVNFETDGGSTIAAVEVSVGDSVTSPANPKKEGYVFAGWYEDAAHTKPVSFPLAVDEDITLFAKWEKEEASVAAGAAAGGAGASAAMEEPQSSSASSAKSASSSGSTSSKDVISSSQRVTENSTVRLTLHGKDGTSRTERIRRQGSTERVIPDSNTRLISREEAGSLSYAERCVAWNEIIASSNGYVFKNSGLNRYFNNCSWYKPRADAEAGGDLSYIASENVKLLQDMTDDWYKSGLLMS